MTNKTARQPIVKLKIESGTLNNYQRACWKKWWAARIAEAKSEVEHGS